jgi:hypothetical protein
VTLPLHKRLAVAFLHLLVAVEAVDSFPKQPTGSVGKTKLDIFWLKERQKQVILACFFF